jgi:hypothetical protein
MSRGELVTSTTTEDARGAVDDALSEMERHLRTLEAWRGELSAAQWNREALLIRRLLEALARLEDE